MNVIPLRSTNITPAMVLEDAARALKNTEQTFVVSFLKDQQGPLVWVSGGDIRLAAAAALVLEDLALAAVHGTVADHPEPPPTRMA